MCTRIDRLKRLPARQRREVLRALDEVSRPMTVREVEHALRAGGLPWSAAKVLAVTLKDRGVFVVTLANGEATPAQ